MPPAQVTWHAANPHAVMVSRAVPSTSLTFPTLLSLFLAAWIILWIIAAGWLAIIYIKELTQCWHIWQNQNLSLFFSSLFSFFFLPKSSLFIGWLVFRFRVFCMKTLYKSVQWWGHLFIYDQKLNRSLLFSQRLCRKKSFQLCVIVTSMELYLHFQLCLSLCHFDLILTPSLAQPLLTRMSRLKSTHTL